MWRSKTCKYRFNCTEMKSFFLKQVKAICVCLHLSVLHFNVKHAKVLFILLLIWMKNLERSITYESQANISLPVSVLYCFIIACFQDWFHSPELKRIFNILFIVFPMQICNLIYGCFSGILWKQQHCHVS